MMWLVYFCLMLVLYESPDFPLRVLKKTGYNSSYINANWPHGNWSLAKMMVGAHLKTC